MCREIQWVQRARCIACTILLAMLSGPAVGAEKEHRQHDVHEHGHGVLQVALDGQELVMVLHIPAVNIVGFESKPGNAEQRKLVSEAIERFSKAAALFVPSKDADCSVEDTEVSLGGMSGDGEHGHDDKDKHAEKHGHDDKDKHAKKHAHDDEDKHAKEHGKDEDDGHSELAAEYHFHCDTPDRLVDIKVKSSSSCVTPSPLMRKWSPPATNTLLS